MRVNLGYWGCSFWIWRGFTLRLANGFWEMLGTDEDSIYLVLHDEDSVGRIGVDEKSLKIAVHLYW